MLAPRRLDFRTIQKTNFFATEVGKNVTYIALAAIGAYVLYTIWKSAQKTAGAGKLETDKYADMATSLYNALYPGMFSNTNEDKIIEMAKSIDDYEMLSKSYNTLFDRVLTDDLLDVLGNRYQEFRDALRIADIVSTELNLQGSEISLLADNIKQNTYKHITTSQGTVEDIPMVAWEFDWTIINGMYNLSDTNLKILYEVYKQKGYGSLYQRLSDSLTSWVSNLFNNEEQDSKVSKIETIVERLNNMNLY